MLMDFRKVVNLPTGHAIEPSTAYITRDVASGRSIMHFSDKDGLALYRTISIQDIVDIVNTGGIAGSAVGMTVYADRSEYMTDNRPQDTFVTITSDVLHNGQLTIGYYLKVTNELINLSNTDTGGSKVHTLTVATRADWDASTVDKLTYVTITADEDRGNQATLSVYMPDEDKLVYLNTVAPTSPALLWTTDDW